MDHPSSKFLNVWTGEEIARMRALAGKKTGGEIAPLVGHTRAATLKKMQQLGIKGFWPGRQGHWTDAQMAALRAAPGRRISCREFAREQGLGKEAVRHWARKLGIKFHREALWSGEETARLRELAPTHTLRALVGLLGRTRRAVRWKAEQLGIAYACQLRPRRERPQRVKPPAREPKPRQPQRKEPKPERIKIVMRRVEHRPSRIEYCPQCGAPVSNWEAHFERMGHRRAS